MKEKYVGKNNKPKMKHSLMERIKLAEYCERKFIDKAENINYQIKKLEEGNLSGKALETLSQLRKDHELCVERSYNYYQQQKSLKKSLKRTVAILGTAVVLGTGTIIGVYANNKSNQNFIDMTNQAYDYVLAENEDQPNPLYEAFLNDIKRYVTLNGKSHLYELSEDEQKELTNIKSRIKSNPEGMNNLALDIVKQKIASHYGIEDYSRITIIDKSGMVQADKYHDRSGKETNVSIYLDNIKIACTHSIFDTSDGEVHTTSNDIQEDLLDAIFAISKAQVNANKYSQDLNKSRKALKEALDLDENSIKLPPIEKDNER